MSFPLECWFWWLHSKPVLSARLLLFAAVEHSWFLRLLQSWREGPRHKAIKTLQNSVFLLRVSHFSWIKVHRIVINLWLISRVMKRLFWQFCQCSQCLYGVVAFQRSILRQVHWCNSRVSSLLNAWVGDKIRQLPAEGFGKKQASYWK